MGTELTPLVSLLLLGIPKSLTIFKEICNGEGLHQLCTNVLYAVDKGLRGRNVLQLVLLILLRICSRSVHPIIMYVYNMAKISYPLDYGDCATIGTQVLRGGHIRICKIDFWAKDVFFHESLSGKRFICCPFRALNEWLLPHRHCEPLKRLTLTIVCTLATSIYFVFTCN